MLMTPVWFRPDGEAVEVVIAEGDVKLGHLRRDPRFVLLVFEAVPPFRGIEIRGAADAVETRDVTETRTAIASRYLGDESGRRFAERRRDRPGFILRVPLAGARTWDLAAALD